MRIHWSEGDGWIWLWSWGARSLIPKDPEKRVKESKYFTQAGKFQGRDLTPTLDAEFYAQPIAACVLAILHNLQGVPTLH